jgi:hypothetical protein
MRDRTLKTGKKPGKKSFWRQHSLTLVAGGILLSWLICYVFSDPVSHIGSFFGNAIADWSGVVITLIATKYFYEIGSRESKQPRLEYANTFLEKLHEHSLTIFLIITGIGWIVVFKDMDPQGKWGTVVSNLISEWSQQIGLVILTKKFLEIGSKESS